MAGQSPDSVIRWCRLNGRVINEYTRARTPRMSRQPKRGPKLPTERLGASAVKSATRSRQCGRRAFETALVGFKALEFGADGNLVGVACPDDEISGRFLLCLFWVGALQPGGVGRARRAWCLAYRAHDVALSQGTCICPRRQDNGFGVPVLAGLYAGRPRSPINLGDRIEHLSASLGGRSSLWR